VIQAYKKEYEREMVEDIKSETDGLFEGNYQALLVSLLTTEKHDPADEKTGIETDSDVLYRAGEGKWGTDEKAFISLMCTRTRGYLAKLNLAYEAKHGKTLQKAIKSETSGDFSDAMCFLCSPIEDFVCEKLHKAMDGIGTNDTTLIFTIVMFRNDHLRAAAKLFKERYEKSLEEWVAGEMSGDYKKTVMSILANFLVDGPTEVKAPTTIASPPKGGEVELATKGPVPVPETVASSAAVPVANPAAATTAAATTAAATTAAATTAAATPAAATPTPDLATQISSLNTLKTQGVLTQEQFDAAVAKLV